MAKVYPQAPLSSASCYLTSKQEVFTIWMKSLVLSGRGCTVFDSNGQIVYRVDNYNCKCSNEVHLMDFSGKVLFTILRKKFKLLRCWEGYRSTGTGIDRRKPAGFQVKKSLLGIPGWKSLCEVMVSSDTNQPFHCKIESKFDSACKIVDKLGGVIAEVKRKRSIDGVVLGNDVLTMVVEPCIDHSLIMGLVVAHCLINYTL